MPITQEKNEVREPFNNAEDSTAGRWVSDRSARTKKGTPGREGHRGGDWESKAMDDAVFYNSLPPGSNVADAEMSDTRVQPFGGPATELSRAEIAQGFRNSPMSSTDEPLSGERPQGFYDSTVVDGKESFIEIQNVMDRN